LAEDQEPGVHQDVTGAYRRRLNELRQPGESYSDVIVKLTLTQRKAHDDDG
jgi:hypothetical protein